MWKVKANGEQEIEAAVEAAVSALDGSNTYIVLLQITDEPTERTTLKDGDAR